MARGQAKRAGIVAQKDPAGAQSHHLDDMRQRGIERLTQIEGTVERLSQRIERAQLGDTLLGIGECGHNFTSDLRIEECSDLNSKSETLKSKILA